MVTYFTALGRLITKEKSGTAIPVVIKDGREYQLNPDELMIWISVHWNFLNQVDFEKEYNRRRNAEHIFNDCSFESVTQRLEIRGLIKSGTDYLAADALYNLVSRLKIRPVRFSIWDKVKSCMYLYFKKGLPFAQCVSAYFMEKTTPNERRVLMLSKTAEITAAEIIQCAENNIKSISSEEEIIDKLYYNPETTSDTIVIDSRFRQLKTDVLQAVANLYLKKKIVFE